MGLTLSLSPAHAQLLPRCCSQRLHGIHTASCSVLQRSYTSAVPGRACAAGVIPHVLACRALLDQSMQHTVQRTRPAAVSCVLCCCHASALDACMMANFSLGAELACSPCGDGSMDTALVWPSKHGKSPFCRHGKAIMHATSRSCLGIAHFVVLSQGS